jgi:(2Fe-2S) ferredoxin
MAKFHKHILICTHERPEGHSSGCCKHANSQEVLLAFKKQIAESGLKRVVRANQSGCLDQCSKGPVVVVYPDAVWYGGVQADDVAEILEQHVLGDRPVTRLQIPDNELTGIPLDKRTHLGGQ